MINSSSSYIDKTNSYLQNTDFNDKDKNTITSTVEIYSHNTLPNIFLRIFDSLKHYTMGDSKWDASKKLLSSYSVKHLTDVFQPTVRNKDLKQFFIEISDSIADETLSVFCNKLDLKRTQNTLFCDVTRDVIKKNYKPTKLAVENKLICFFNYFSSKTVGKTGSGIKEINMCLADVMMKPQKTTFDSVLVILKLAKENNLMDSKIEF